MKSDFIILCLVGMEKTPLFMMEYQDVDMSWIDEFTDFSIHAVKHGIDKYKKNKTGKTPEMVLLPMTMLNDDDEVSIEDQVCFIFEDVLKRFFFASIKLVESVEERCCLISWRQRAMRTFELSCEEQG